jgi:hypothetical protein
MLDISAAARTKSLSMPLGALDAAGCGVAVPGDGA